MSQGEGMVVCAWTPVYLRDEAWGRLHVLKHEGAPTEVDLLGLDRAAAAAGLALLADRNAAGPADDARALVLGDVARRRLGREQMVERARGLGVDLRGRQLVALVIAPSRRSDAGEYERVRDRARLLADARAATTEAGCSVLVASDGDRVIAIVGVPPGRDVRDAVGAAWGGLGARLRRARPGRAVVVGSSEEDGDLPRAMARADEAAAYALGTTLPNRTPRAGTRASSPSFLRTR